jgi:tetratricopeptide (TPR) repeat protein/predicted Ser/Thr protein kinase
MRPSERTTDHSAGMIAQVSAEDPASVEAVRMRAALEHKLFATDLVPTRIGRFVVIDVLGRGGSGVVYRAFDGDLDRTVAVKVLASASELHRARLLREAKALARLNHPNVVAVYEVGEDRGRVFLAMEHVDGGSLADVCARRGEGGSAWITEVIGWLEQCARGLAAAHRVGLVHRDLKPGNILIGNDGRARLADFGLARTELREPTPFETAEQISAEAPARLTATGAVLGTPAYMAPEQLRGEADERTDQFGLCASFYEALWGTRAYPGSDRATLFASLEAGRLVVPPPSVVPEHVRRVLLRGLSPRAEDRFASIEALLLALDRGRRRRRRALVLGGTLAAGIGGWLALASAADPIPPCTIDEVALDHAWGPTRRAAVEHAIMTTGVPYARTTWTVVAGSLDELAAKWADDDLAACRQSRDADPEVAAVDASRRECTAAAIATFEAATSVLAGLDGQTVHQANQISEVVADLVDCEASTRGENEEGMRLAVIVDRAELERRLARFDRARQLATSVLDAARPGELPRLRASAALVLARVHGDRGERQSELQSLRAALTEAELADDAVLMAASWQGLALDAARNENEDQASFYLERAARLEREGRLDDHSRAVLLREEGRVAQVLEKAQAAVGVLERAVGLFDALGDDGYEYADLLTQYAAALEYADRITDAIAVGEQAVARYEAILGEDHPLVAERRITIARMYSFVQDEERAERELLRSRRVLEATPDYRPDVRATLYNDLAQTYANLGRFDEALATIDLALALRRELDGGTCSRRCVQPMLSRARILLVRDDREGARALLEETLAIARSGSAGADAEIGEVQLLRAETLALTKQPEAAREALGEARTMLARVYAPDSGLGLQTTQKIGHIQGLAGDVQLARETLRAGIVRATEVGARDYVGRMHWELGLLHARDGEFTEARIEFESARATYVEAGVPHALVAEIDDYIRQLSG